MDELENKTASAPAMAGRKQLRGADKGPSSNGGLMQTALLTLEPASPSTVLSKRKTPTPVVERPSTATIATDADLMAESKRKWCLGCKAEHPISDFGKHTQAADGLKSDCKAFRNKQSREYQNTRVGFFVQMAGTLKANSKLRGQRGRGEAAQFNAVAADIDKMHDSQNGACSICKLPMVLKQSSHWQASFNRKDNSKGETIENGELVCLEFNIATPGWCWEKVQEIHRLSTGAELPVPLATLIDNARTAPESRRAHYPKCQETKDGKVEWFCNGPCQSFKPLDDMWKGKKTECKRCCANRQYSSIYSFIKKLLNTAKSKNKKRNRKLPAGAPTLLFNITFSYLLRLFEQQRARCFYSNVPFLFRCFVGDRRTMELLREMSLERLDPKKGYVKGNVAFILRGFQSTDRSRTVKYSNGGSGGWSKCKAAYLFQWIPECLNGLTKPSMTFEAFERQYNEQHPQSNVFEIEPGSDSEPDDTASDGQQTESDS